MPRIWLSTWIVLGVMVVMMASALPSLVHVTPRPTSASPEEAGTLSLKDLLEYASRLATGAAPSVSARTIVDRGWASPEVLVSGPSAPMLSGSWGGTATVAGGGGVVIMTLEALPSALCGLVAERAAASRRQPGPVRLSYMAQSGSDAPRALCPPGPARVRVVVEKT